MIQQMDHVAVCTVDYDGKLGFYRNVLGFTLGREGTRTGAGTRIAMLRDPLGTKIELIEIPAGEPEGVDHIAYRVDDVQAAYDTLLANGSSSIRPPSDLPPAKAVTAMVQDATGQKIQVIKYAPDSPDL
jgi:catechol 2,3-dioxygenase-like lactoylglutathione lyase family enzyme